MSLQEQAIEWPSRDVYRAILRNIGNPAALGPDAVRAGLAVAGPEAPRPAGGRSVATTLVYDCRRNEDDIPPTILGRVCGGRRTLDRIDYSDRVARDAAGDRNPPETAALESGNSHLFWDEAQGLLAGQPVEVVELSADRDFVLARSGHFPFQQRVWAVLPTDPTHLAVVYLNIEGREQAHRQSVANITIYLRR